MSAVLDFVSDTGASVFISSHLVHELERFCDWVGVIDDGNMVAEMPMQSFKEEIKRLRVLKAPVDLRDEPPFELLGRRPSDGASAGETWVVRGWESPMEAFFQKVGATVREVSHLDLEEGFVELLTSARPDRWNGRNGSHPDLGDPGPVATLSTHSEEG